MKVLITGINGFVGSHLSDFISSHYDDYEIHGTVRKGSDIHNIEHSINRITIHSLDLNDSKSLESVLQLVKPTKVFHLASQSNVMNSFQNPIETFQTNVMGTLNLLEAVRKTEIDPVLQIASSSEVYGQVLDNETPIKETNPFRPINPYGVSKVAVDRLAFQYYSSYGIKTIITRAFSHTGPRRNQIFAESNFAKQIAEIEKGSKEPIVHVGNLNSTRTFADVRDIAEAYWLATEKCDYGEAYNIGSIQLLAMKDILDILVNMSLKKITITEDKSRLRPIDISNHIPDITKFLEKTNWKIKIPIQKTLQDLLEYWRKMI
ncbi:SDR family oxidoreductase [Candidatus Parcubacteria bacterium]|nr:MAG: SDR family oxidoreductase [Candidatus Parcubacteria bacterium]